MAMGRRQAQQQADLFIATSDLPQSPGHVFYEKLNQLLAEADFDRHVEDLCQPHYAEDIGRESIPPGVYFRMLLVGYFEGIDSQRGIAWRCSDSLSLRAFLGVPWNEATPQGLRSTNRLHSSWRVDFVKCPHLRFSWINLVHGGESWP